MFKNKFRFSNQSYIISIFDMKDDSYRWNTLKLFFFYIQRLNWFKIWIGISVSLNDLYM